MSEADARSLLVEAQVLSRLSHPGIVRFLGSSNTQLAHNITMEFCPGGDLQTRVSRLPGRRIPPNDFLPVALGLLQALSYLHSERVMHRDIKVRRFGTPIDYVIMSLHASP